MSTDSQKYGGLILLLEQLSAPELKQMHEHFTLAKQDLSNLPMTRIPEARDYIFAVIGDLSVILVIIDGVIKRAGDN